MTRRRRYPQSSSRRALVSLEQLQRLPLVLEDRVPLRPDDIRARTRRALRCCVVAAANGAPATVFSTIRALPDSGQQRVAVAEARGAMTPIPEWEPRQAARCGRLTPTPLAGDPRSPLLHHARGHNPRESSPSVLLVQSTEEAFPPGCHVVAAQNRHHGPPSLASLLERHLHCHLQGFGNGIGIIGIGYDRAG